MNHLSTLTKLACLFSIICLTSCHHRKNVWDDSNTAAHLNTLDSYWGNAFDNSMRESDFNGPHDEDFLALNEEDLTYKTSDGAVPQSRLIPGDPGSGIPSLTAFSVPQGELREVFNTVHFGTDQYSIKDPKNLQSLQRAASYLKSHPTTYVFVAGHCDARGSESYNLALGTRRADWVRGYLVKNGASPNQIFTVSFGKEKPIDTAASQNAWAKNRRAEFKIYSK